MGDIDTVRLRRVFKSGDIPRTYLPRYIIIKTVEKIRQYGKKGCEGLVFWAGVITKDGSKLVTTCVIPKVERASSISVSSDVLSGAEVVREVRRRRLELIAEVHSHPGGGVGHSYTDDKNPFVTAEDNLSVVVPSLGEDGMEPLHKCGIHRYVAGNWIRLSEREVDEDFSVVDDVVDLGGIK